MALHHLAIHGDGVIQGISNQQPKIKPFKTQQLSFGQQMVQLRGQVAGPRLVTEQNAFESLIIYTMLAKQATTPSLRSIKATWRIEQRLQHVPIAHTELALLGSAIQTTTDGATIGVEQTHALLKSCRIDRQPTLKERTASFSMADMQMKSHKNRQHSWQHGTNVDR